MPLQVLRAVSALCLLHVLLSLSSAAWPAAHTLTWCGPGGQEVLLALLQQHHQQLLLLRGQGGRQQQQSGQKH